MLRLLDRLEEVMIGTLIAGATLLIFVSVVHRYSLGIIVDMYSYARAHDIAWAAPALKQTFLSVKSINLVWAQELCIYMFVWMAKFGAAYGVRTGIHVGIDVLINRMAPDRRRVMILFGLACGAFFTGVIAILGANFVHHMYYASSISPDLEIQMWIVYLAVPVGSALMCFRFLQVAFAFARTGELPHHDHGHVDGIEDADTEAVEAAPVTPDDAGIAAGSDRLPKDR